MIDLCQWRARIGSWNCSRHWRQPSACTSTGNTYCGTGRASAGNTVQVKAPRLVLSIFCLLILLFISGDVELNPGPTETQINVATTLKTRLQSHLATLYDATKHCLESVAVRFSSKGLISWEVTSSPTFLKMVDQFKASLTCNEKNLTKLEEGCRDFVHCLAKAGGPAKDAAIALAEDWEREVFNKHHLKWSLTVDIETSTDLSISSEILLDSEVPQKAQDLHKKFISVMKQIRAYYNECKQYEVKDFARYLTDDYEEPLTKEPLTNCESFDNLLHLVKCHYSFFNFDLIEDLATEFPPSDEVQLELDQYVQELEQFKKSTSLQQMKDAIKQVPLPHEASEAHCKIVIKLTGSWRNKTVKSLENLIQYLFERDAKRAKLIEVKVGSIIVTFLAFSTAQSLVDKVQDKSQFIQYLGIFQIIINNDIVIDREEDANFAFQDSLLHAINHIESDAEYERVALLLIELKIPLNYKNIAGQTALMLASECGHIEIFKSLLQNGANPFVQIPSNEGYIGLNRLACTALSQHVYKSIGGKKIIPQDDVSVEEMLEMAVKERGVSIYKFLYSPFIHIVKNCSKAKFQWLQNGFHSLNSNFIDTATNLLTSKALVAETKQHLQSYIKEDATCENAHQLVQLLQPHYSCLNINLLTIPCTITEPIKEQVEEYNTNLKMFKDTTTLLELAMVAKGMLCPDGVGCSLILLKLDKSWCSRTIAELNKVENCNLSSFLTLFEIQYGASNLTCSYLIPQLHTKALSEAVSKQGNSLCEIGIDEVATDGVPMIMKNKEKSIGFETALLKVLQNYLPPLIFGELKKNYVNTRLIAASEKGDLSTVKFLLSQDPDINFQGNALMVASRNGHHQVVELLLSKDPDVKIQKNKGVNALLFASAYGHHKVVELLLSKDPDINIQNGLKGDTALIAASRFGQSQVVKVLLSKDPDINIQNDDGWTALFTASSSGHHQVVEFLLSKDPDINIQSNMGESALMAAGCYGHHQVVELLLSKEPDINIQDKNGATALMYASGNGHNQVVELLLSKNPDINIKKNDGGTALIAASANGHHQVVELLLSKNPDINSQDDDRQTALMGASANGHHQVVELLLSKNPDINIRDKDGVTALMFASYFGHNQVVEFLLNNNSDINLRDNEGHSALTFTLVCSTKTFVTDDDIPLDNCTQLLNHNATLEILLKSHPNHTHLVDGKEFHSLAVAALFNNFDAVTILVEKCTITPEHIISAFTAACYAGHSSMIIHLSEKITSLSNNERTLLVAAAEGDLGTLISMIINDGPDGMSPDTPLVAGITPLMIAASCGHIELVEALIQTGADVKKRNDGGMNALDIVNDIEHYDRSKIKDLLITNTPTGEPDPVSKNDELTEKKSSTVTISIKSIFRTFKSFMKKAYKLTYVKQKEMKISSKSGITDRPYSAMTSNTLVK